MDKICHSPFNNRKRSMISERADFRASKVISNKVGNYIIIKGSILQKDITMLTIPVLNDSTLR